MSWWTTDRKRYALNYLLSAGLSPYGAAGLVSRWAYVEAPNGPASRGGYLGRAWGIAQWLGPRLPPINGNTSFDAQLAYVVFEINGSEARAGQLLRSAATVDQGARAATAYERAGGYNASTNVDHYTAKTAAGIPAVLALLQAPASAAPQQAAVIGVNPVIPFPSLVNVDDPVTETAISGSAFLLAGAVVLGLYLILR